GRVGKADDSAVGAVELEPHAVARASNRPPQRGEAEHEDDAAENHQREGDAARRASAVDRSEVDEHAAEDQHRDQPAEAAKLLCARLLEHRTLSGGEGEHAPASAEEIDG